MTNSILPTKEGNIAMEQKTRLPYLDLLRGIAVLGLLFMNLPGMGIPDMGYVRLQPDLLSDQIIATIQSLFFDGRFRTLFCLLFGIGLYLQYQSYRRKELNAYVILKSRLKWLFLFGLIHCVFIWPGDILIMYALSGLYLYSKLEWSAEKLIKRGTVFFAVGLVIMSLEVFLTEYFREEALTRSSAEYLEALSIVKGSYLDIVIVNLVFALAYILTFPILILFYIGGTMMLGLGLFKSGKLQYGFDNKELIILIVVTVVVSGFDAIFAFAWPEIRQSFITMPGTISGFSMALLIWHFVLKLDLANSKAWLSQALQKVGRMAFTLYISQSLVMAGLFRYAYPEWNETFVLLDYMAITLGFTLFQLVFASWYLNNFQQGPLEKLWRNLVNKTIKKQEEQQASLQQEVCTNEQ